MQKYYPYIIVAAIILIGVLVRYILFLHSKLKTNNNMATLADLQASDTALASAATGLQTAIANWQTAHSGDITSVQADGIKASIDSVTTTLTQLAASIPTS